MKLLAALALAFAHAEAATPPLTLKEALTYAMEHAPTLAVIRESESIARMQAKSAQAALLPSLSIDSAHGVSKDLLATTSNPWTGTAAVSLTQTFFNNGDNYTDLRATRWGREAAELDTRIARENLSFEILQEFYRWSQTVVVLKIREDQNVLLKKQFDLIERQFKQGLSTREDYLRIKAQTLRAESDLIAARTEAERAVLTLNRLIGAPAEDRKTFVSIEPLALLPSITTTGAPEVVENPRLKARSLRQDIADAQAKRAKRSVWPRLSLSGQLSYGSSGYVNTGAQFLDNDTLNSSVTLGATWTLWNWGTVQRDASIARSRENQEYFQLQHERIQLQADAAKLALELERRRANLKIDSELLAIEQRNYLALEEKYRQGSVRYLDLIKALDDLAEAKTRSQADAFLLLQAAAQYRFFEGNLYEAITQAP